MKIRSKIIVPCILSILLFILSGLTYLNEVSFEQDDDPSKSFIEQQTNDSALMSSGEITRSIDSYKRTDGSEIRIITYAGKENMKYQSRFVSAIKASLKFFEGHIAEYPHNSVTIVDALGTSGKFFASSDPSVISIGAGMFSPLETQQPEYLIVYTFTQQFLYGVKKNKEDHYRAFDEGLTTYLSRKIMHKYYGNPVVTFDLFEYYPISGLNFLSYNEIPLIYSLGKYYYSEGAISFEHYIKAPQMYSVADSLNILPDDPNLKKASWSKPHLALLSVERYIGFEKMMSIVRDYVTADKQRNANEFISLIQNNTNEDLTWLFENLFYGSSIFDYKIKDVKRAQKYDNYNVYAERLGDGIFKQEVALYTKKDTLHQMWDGRERWKIFTFSTNNEVIGAEIDPYRKNILDCDYSNNSYFIKHQYGGSISLSLRWFFWMQNLLLILGSIA